jgi:hypothetical protein
MQMAALYPKGNWGQDRLSAFLGIKWQKVKPDTRERSRY